MNIKTIALILAFSTIINIGYSQSASVTPSRLYYKAAPGEYKSQTIRVTNNGAKAETFKVSFANFSSEGNKGKTTIDSTINDNRGCSQWLSASPSFFEVNPGETKDVEILLQVPNTPEANNTRWAVTSIKLARENKGDLEKGKDVVGMQIIQTFQFVVHIFQTPPTVTLKEATVLKFYRDTIASDSAIRLNMEIKNSGETIIDCAPYLDVVNMNTGEKTRVKNRAFSVLPGGQREIYFYLPKELKKGEYNILGIVDYGSVTELTASELNITIK